MRACRPVLLGLVLPLVLLLAVAELGGIRWAPGAVADPMAPEPATPADTAANPAVRWTPPPEPALEPVPIGACPAHPAPGAAACLTEVSGDVPDAKAAEVGRADAIGSSDTATAPLPDAAVPQAVSKAGRYSPADLAGLYRIPAGLTSDATIGIIDVGSDPNTQAQLSYYRKYFGLPSCTSTNGCFREVSQDGGSALPATDSAWVTEIALDVQAVSAICPSCHILLVDATSASAGDLGAAARTAVRLGASYVSMSYGSPDSSRDAALNLTYYNAAGVTYVAATGDSGYAGGTVFPSSATNVVAVGGTSATLVNGSWQQSAWSGGGSGCSSTGLSGGVTGLVQALLSGSACPNGRAVSDVSALADANTGIMFYLGGRWYSGGGTSLAAPIVAAMYALAGNHTDPLAIYHNVSSRPSTFVDVTRGQNGACGSILCAAASGWDGPTGVGTPAGLAGLASAGSAPLPLAAPTTAGALSRFGGSYPVWLSYRLVDATTGAPVPGATAIVEGDTGAGFVVVGSATTGSDGSLVHTARPHGPTTYRVLYGGDTTHAASTSPAVPVRAFAPRVHLRATHGGLRVRATAPWAGPAAGVPVTVQKRVGSGRWRTTAHHVTSARGVVTARLRHPGAYRARYGGGQWDAGRTAVVRFHHR